MIINETDILPLAGTLNIPCVDLDDAETIDLSDGSSLEVTMPSADTNYADCFVKFTMSQDSQLNFEVVNYNSDVRQTLRFFLLFC